MRKQIILIALLLTYNTLLFAVNHNDGWITVIPPSASSLKYKDLSAGNYEIIGASGQNGKVIRFYSKVMTGKKVKPTALIAASIVGKAVTLAYRLQNGSYISLTNNGDIKMSGHAYFVNIPFKGRKKQQFFSITSPFKNNKNINNWLPMNPEVAAFKFDWNTQPESL